MPALPILAALVGVSAQARAQALDWQRNPANGRWYAETAAPTSWSGAEALAQFLGGHLTTVRSQAESDWLDQNFFSQLTLFRHHWIGLRQDRLDPAYSEPAGGWGWASGEPLTFTNWAPGQPDNAGGRQDFGRSGGTTGGSTAAWHDDSNSGAAAAGNSDDWYIASGQLVVLDTSSSQIQSSSIQFVPGSDAVQSVTPLGTRLILGGVVYVDDLVIEAGGVLQVVGPNSFVVMASGRVVIGGKLDASGFSSIGVVTLNTTSIPEAGAAGRAGGGDGGTGSPLTTVSSPAGGNGFGPFGRVDGGGRGGETGWSNLASENLRRGAGGGGGRMGANLPAVSGSGQFDQRRIGLDAEAGFDNTLASFGALSGQPGAKGGAIGPSPFRDGNPDNDFYGRRLDSVTGAVIVGELARPWAGSGGGGGGDASRFPSGTFPGPFHPAGDEKGAGGGGGGGSVHLLANGRIVFGIDGQILARGGTGGGGENTIFLNRVGGGSGGGSGGHVVLQSLSAIDLRAKQAVDWNLPIDEGFAIDTRGGQGGVGRDNLGGASAGPTGVTESLPSVDACPPGYTTSGANACRGHIDGAGGDGGPGIVQFHTPRGKIGTDPLTADILIAAGTSIDQFSAPLPVGLAASGTSELRPDVGEGLGLLELDSIDCDSNGVPDKYEIALDPGRDSDRDGLLDGVCDLSTSYCFQNTSGGCPAVLGSTGRASTSAVSGFELIASSLPGQRSAQIFYGLFSNSTPFGSGTLCVQTPVQRLVSGNTGGTAGACDGELRIDWNAWRSAHPGALGSPFSVGQSIFAQTWYRDSAGGPLPRFTNAHTFTLTP